MKFSISLVLGVGLFCGAWAAIDLTGCAPKPPQIINAPFNGRGEIKSPGFDENTYPNKLNCIYSIRAPFGQRIKLTFKHLDIDPFDMCMKDRVRVHEGPDERGGVHGVYCGDQKPNDIISIGNALTLVFSSDFLTGRKGFHVEYSIGMLHSYCPLGEAVCRNRNCYRIVDRCNGVDNCGDGTDEENCRLPVPTIECGVTPIQPYESEGLNRIIGGREAKPGSWPWQADLQLAIFSPNGHNCGATLINAEWLLSAAHCFQRNTRTIEWRIHLGNHHKFEKDAYEQVRYPKRIIVYPGYTGDQELVHGRVDFSNDIALVKLNAPVKFTDYVRPACLPSQLQTIQVGKECMASGWGTTRGTGSNDVLKQVPLSVLPANKCRNNMIPFLEKTMICVRNAKGFQDVCHGDSGGPLVCKFDNLWYLMGATSYGTLTNFMGGACSLPGAHTVFTRVSDKIQWIKNMMQLYSN